LIGKKDLNLFDVAWQFLVGDCANLRCKKKKRLAQITLFKPRFHELGGLPAAPAYISHTMMWKSRVNVNSLKLPNKAKSNWDQVLLRRTSYYLD
jgi:hypothetical protein